MEIFYFGYFVSFCLGTILTSFLQVAAVEFGDWYVKNKVYDTPSEGVYVYKWLQKNWAVFTRSLSRRSRCDVCDKNLTALQLVPIISLLVSWGECTGCGSKISWKYLWAELAGGIVLVGLYHYFVSSSLHLSQYAFVLAFLLIVLFMLGLAITFIDLKYMLIPNIVVYPFVLVGLLFTTVLYANTGVLIKTLIYSALAAASFFTIIWAMWAYSKGRWIGYADAKLVLAVGFILCFSAGFTALAFACWAGAVVGLALMAFENIQRSALPDEAQELTIKSAIPFGPFILFGLWAVLVTGINMFSLTV